MRKRLFIDCDDTLILYDTAEDDAPSPYGYIHGQPYHVNEALAASVRAWAHDNPCSMVVVWSGGGERYARTIAGIALPGLAVQTMVKDATTFDLARSGDIVVDDMAGSVGGIAAEVLKPDEWRYNGSG